MTPSTTAHQTFLSCIISQRLLKLVFIVSVMPSSHLILCRPLLLLPAVFSSIRMFSNELGLCTRWPKYWSFSFSISPSDEYIGLISFKIDWFDLLVVQRTLKNLLSFSGGSHNEQPACDAGDPSLIPGWEDPLEKGMATHSSILAWRILWTEKPGGLQFMGSQRSDTSG